MPASSCTSTGVAASFVDASAPALPPPGSQHLDFAHNHQRSASRSNPIQALCRHVMLPYMEFARGNSSIALLAEPLAQRPELARKVHGLTMSPQNGDILVDKAVMTASLQIGLPISLQDSRDYVNEMEVAKQILHMLGNLKDLQITSLSGDYNLTADQMDNEE
ncbi:hypothetical protein CC86DRAFT_409758 [Ophiobolus disseminans]|uniref:Uncharacterized protein n=1 Tax=Ophiobolus disseminans TaxID=1469910 RepID=A0A6A6ZRN1_9PLEO|nr:hypothetical protein CC86DRAFT_409758 [Ophiobolus disseminans]